LDVGAIPGSASMNSMDSYQEEKAINLSSEYVLSNYAKLTLVSLLM